MRIETDSQHYTDIAEAIRDMNGTENTYYPEEMASAILAIPQETYDVYAPIIYSLEEREVGVWTDGKPLYQKTIDCGSLPSAQTKSITHGISNIDFVASYFGSCSGYTPTVYYPLPLVQGSSSLTNYQVKIEVDSTYIKLTCGADLSPIANSFITLQYTKTTDVAGSGTWGTDGVPMVHYDGTERIIGTWFGETLYQKTVTIPISSQIGDITYTIDSGLSVVNAFGIIKTVGGFKMVLPASYSNIFWCGLQHDSNYIRLSIYSSSDWQQYNALTEAVVTIQYTKTSS